MIRDLLHVRARLFNRPQLISELRLEPLIEGLHAAMLHRGSLVSPDDERAGPSPDQRPRGYWLNRGVAIVPVRGVLVRRGGKMSPDSTPLQSYEALSRTLRAVGQDSRARGVLLDVDSPGGEASGVFDLAKEVRQLGEVKPLWAIANEDCLSAAYVIASSAARLWTTQTGAVGSLGAVAVHSDQSAYDAADGFKYTYIFKGAHKIDGNPHEPLGVEARQQIQAEVNRINDLLIETVARDRNLSPEHLSATEAKIYFGDQALPPRLADGLGTLGEATAALAAKLGTARVAPAASRRSAMENEETAEVEMEPAADNVVPFDPVPAAVAATRNNAAEIAERCVLAGYAQLAPDFIREGTSLEAAVRFLQAKRAAASPAIETIDTTQTAAPGDSYNAQVAAAKARFAARR